MKLKEDLKEEWKEDRKKEEKNKGILEIRQHTIFIEERLKHNFIDFSGADIQNMVNTAAIKAAMDEKVMEYWCTYVGLWKHMPFYNLMEW